MNDDSSMMFDVHWNLMFIFLGNDSVGSESASPKSPTTICWDQKSFLRYSSRR